jgi:YkoY family integral membrane protein
MFGQAFQINDLGTVGFLVLLEALLSADNALILAIIVRHLPKEEQKKALLYGLLGAFALRLAAIVVATQIISFWWLQVLGAFYLLYLPTKHFIQTNSSHPETKTKKSGFWMTVIYADFADLAFALDSVLVAVAIEPHKSKIWVVYAGAVIGIVLLRVAANFFINLLEKYPFLDHVAYTLVGWAGIKLVFLSGHTFEKWFIEKYQDLALPFDIPEMPPLVFWLGILLIVGIGGYLAVRNAKKEGDVSYIRDQVEDIEGE